MKNGKKNPVCPKNSFITYLMNQVFIQKNQKTQFRDSISVGKKVACILYYLADQARFLMRIPKVANSFGAGKSTASKIVRTVSKAISVHLAPKYLSLLTSENEIVKLEEKFYEAHGFPQ